MIDAWAGMHRVLVDTHDASIGNEGVATLTPTFARRLGELFSADRENAACRADGERLLYVADVADGIVPMHEIIERSRS